MRTRGVAVEKRRGKGHRSWSKGKAIECEETRCGRWSCEGRGQLRKGERSEGLQVR